MSQVQSGVGARVIEAIEREREQILDVACQIHARPEPAFTERFASALLAERLREARYEVEYPVGGLETAFRARRRGAGPGPCVALLAEYDSLPVIGHGCGHNLIAASALAGAIGLGAALDEVGGTAVIVGTPAEEGGGGKVILLERGVFDGVDAALMVHHGGNQTGVARRPPDGTTLAAQRMRYAFHGRTAHAAADPHLGANALNACMQFFAGIDALRQHMRPDARVHGIIAQGGEAANVVPKYALARFSVRAADRAYRDELLAKIADIARGAALMTGCTAEIAEDAPGYNDVRPSYVLGDRYCEHMARVGLEPTPAARAGRGSYSTDLGNLSYRMPVASGSFAISAEPIPGHSQQVVDGSISPLGLANTLKVSQAMALTALDILTDPALLPAARAEHARWESGELGAG